MAPSVRVALFPPTTQDEIAGVVELVCGVDADPHSTSSTPEGESSQVVLAALRYSERLWLFWLTGQRGVQSLGGHKGAALFSALALQSEGIFVWPRDSAYLEECLRPLRRSCTDDFEDVELGCCREYGLIGHSQPFLRALRTLTRLARYDVPVLLEGETGTGKELFARVLHYRGARSTKPFVPVNCAALPDTLLENELFGHVRGAFTDARGDKRGLVAQADGGTLFFDEVHCLSPKGQATLLRFLQDQQYRPLGTERLLQTDVRIVAATNRVLDREVADGRFREDLLYRLRVADVHLPALRERQEDIPVLAENALSRLCTRYHIASRRFDPESLAWLSTCPWPGNIRELENFVCRALLLSEDPIIHIDLASETASDACDAQRDLRPFNDARAQAVSKFEARYLSTLLSLTKGNVSEAARRAGKDRRVFGRLMKKHAIERAGYVGD